MKKWALRPLKSPSPLRLVGPPTSDSDPWPEERRAVALKRDVTEVGATSAQLTELRAMTTRLDNTLNSLNSATSKVRNAARAALRSRAFGLFVVFAVFFAFTFVMCVLCTYVAKFCFAVFGEWLGLAVYLLFSFALVIAIEAMARKATFALQRRRYARR